MYVAPSPPNAGSPPVAGPRKLVGLRAACVPRGGPTPGTATGFLTCGLGLLPQKVLSWGDGCPRSRGANRVDQACWRPPPRPRNEDPHG